MYAKKTWGGTEDPTIEVSFKKKEIPQILSFSIWEFEDVDYLGRVFDGEVRAPGAQWKGLKLTRAAARVHLH